MRLGRLLRRLVSWIACCAILVGALAPAVSHALQAGAGGSTWTEVCTALGAKLVKVEAAASDNSSPPSGPLLEHCPYCSLHATPGLPPSPLSVPVLAATPEGPPERFLTAPRTPFAWASAQPRAPPSRS